MNGYDRRDRNVTAGIIAGVIGGLVGTWAMSEFQGMWSRVIDGEEPQSAGGRHDARDWQEKVEGQNANELAANEVAEHTINRPLTREELEVAAPAMHYAFGAAMGALYGGLYEASRNVRAMGGTGLRRHAGQMVTVRLSRCRRPVELAADRPLQERGHVPAGG